MGRIKVAVSGAFGRMGREVCRAVLNEESLELVGAFDLQGEDEDIGEILRKKPLGIKIEKLSKESLKKVQPDVMVDFTTPMSVIDNIELALQCGVRPVVGTTGITQVDLSRIGRWVDASGLSAIIAPNFALGAVLMMKFVSIAARYFPQAEIIELHHDQKIDAPSGTALKTANIIIECREEDPPERDELIKLSGARGAVQDKVHIHSIRLSGLVAHQEVIFGGTGQTLTIRHDSIDRQSFMPGVIFAVKKAASLQGLVYGLENLMDW
ncbi:MAG: 4-hydroxy-tetrahydrodipicolinate reductase [Firmicutes bacterium]|jgi:4-hydroxy-tetrahydrodipicolinate reductase|nr:4-hydroxy-tetrahydrodipicolinate reductase [Bacillota bacterium]